MNQIVETGYQAREAFAPLHMRRERFAVVVAHRRAGKTVAAINDLVDAALRCTKPDPRFAYVAPYYTQAKDVAWLYLKNYTAAIPGVKFNESELRVDLPNGGRVRLYGADNYDRMRGIYLDGVVLDEYADMHPAAWSEVIRPALADRQGWAMFIGTPKGRNAFCDLYEKAIEAPDWFAMRLKASETGLIEPAELEALRREMSENEFLREMETSFDAAVDGAYFAPGLQAAENEGRICNLAADPLMTVRAYWDIGGSGAKADATAIWITQFIGREIRILDHYETRGQPLAEHLNWLRSHGWEKAQCVLPHDGASNDKVYAVSFESAIRSAEFDVRVYPNAGAGAASMRIETARRLMPAMWWDRAKTKAGRDALAWYHERRDEKRGIGLGPEHDWSSHSADAFGLMAMDYEAPKAKGVVMPKRNLSWVV
jgi:phage terminase large subunit